MTSNSEDTPFPFVLLFRCVSHRRLRTSIGTDKTAITVGVVLLKATFDLLHDATLVLVVDVQVPVCLQHDIVKDATKYNMILYVLHCLEGRPSFQRTELLFHTAESTLNIFSNCSQYSAVISNFLTDGTSYGETSDCHRK